MGKLVGIAGGAKSTYTGLRFHIGAMKAAYLLASLAGLLVLPSTHQEFFVVSHLPKLGVPVQLDRFHIHVCIPRKQPMSASAQPLRSVVLMKDCCL